MNRKLIPILIANLFAVTAASADDGKPADNANFVWSGEVSAGGVGSNVNPVGRNVFSGPATNDAGKFNEYRDLDKSGLTGSFDIKGRGDRYYLNAFGENLDRHDQYLNLQGGMYDVFKYRLFDDRMVHNLSWNLLTPFNGAGGTNLTSIGGAAATGLVGGPDVNPYNWNLFDASLKKENLGGYLEISKNSPWYFRVDANQATTKGIQPSSASNTFSSGGGSIDLPMPIDYKTQNYSLETGYANKRGLINVSFSQSFFTNSNTSYTWQDPRFGNGINTQLEAQNSVQTKLGINGTLRQLPLNSTFSSRVSYSQLTNSLGVDGPGYTRILTGAGPTFTTTNATPGRFDGKIVNSNGSFSLTSNPYKNADTRLYYNWYQRQNESPRILYAGGPALGAEGYGQVFSYRKDNFGLDANYRINPDNRLGVGVSQQKIDRTVGNLPLQEPITTIDNTYYVEYKNSTLDQLSGRLRYERVNRMSGNWDISANRATTVNPAYSRPMDTANFHQDRAKLALDANPAALVDLGFQAIYKMTNYDASNYGLKYDNRQEYSANVSYGDAQKFRVTAFADYELIHYVDYWFVGTLQGPVIPANYNLYTQTRSTNKMFGLGGDWPVTEKFKMNASYIYLRTTGGVDFLQNATGTGGCAAGSLFFCSGPYAGGIVPYNTDNSTKQSVTLTGKYTVNKNWSMTGTYAYEKYSYRDDQMNGFGGNYAYFAALGGAGPLNSTFAGAYQNPSYTAQIFRLMANYKF